MPPAPDPRVSVVTAVRNDRERLVRTWASLREQLGTGFEWVVVDGASDDGSVDWLAALGDPRVRWTSEPDAGVYDAMNRGLARAECGLVTFLNAGDTYLRPRVLADVVERFVGSPADWGFGKALVVDAAGHPVRPATGKYGSRARYAFGRNTVIHQTVFARTAALQRLGGFDLRFPIAADFHLTLRLGELSEPLVWPTVDVAYEEGGISDVDPAASLRDMHAARVAVYGMGDASARADSVWTGVLTGYVKGRRVAKAAARTVLGQRGIDWWAGR